MNIDNMIAKLDELEKACREYSPCLEDIVFSQLRAILLAGKEDGFEREMDIAGHFISHKKMIDELEKRVADLERQLKDFISASRDGNSLRTERIEALEFNVNELYREKKDAPEVETPYCEYCEKFNCGCNLMEQYRKPEAKAECKHVWTNKQKENEMETKINEIEVNGGKYVPKDSIGEQKAESLDGMPYQIVRTYSAGVFAGYVKSRVGQEVVMTKARRLWYWNGATTLSQIATTGVTKPNECKFACEVDVTLINAIEILEVTDKAKKIIQGVKVWEN